MVRYFKQLFSAYITAIGTEPGGVEIAEVLK